MRRRTALLWGSLGLLASALVCSGSDPSDTAALKGLQSCVKAAGKPAYLTGWDGSDPCATPIPWTGLLCTGGRVTSVVMSQLGPNSLKGCDVGSLGDLANLEKVSLVDFTATAIEGYLPASWGSGFGALTSLTLAKNRISGSLPASWGDGFKALQTLNLESNSLNGTLPSSWSTGFPALLNLILSNNRIEGKLPKTTPGWGKLETLLLHDNLLHGGLPGTWDAPQLKTLELWNNQIGGCLPGAWPRALPRLQALKVSGNALRGRFPAAWDDWDSLTSLSFLPGNAICGDVSAQLAATPDGRGRRIQPEPANRTANGGYRLEDCPANLSCQRIASAEDFAGLAPAPAPSDGDEAAAASALTPDTAPAAAGAPEATPLRIVPAAQQIVAAGRRRLRHHPRQ